MIKADLTGALSFAGDFAPVLDEAKQTLARLLAGSAGVDGTGWLKLPEQMSAVVPAVMSAAQRICADSQVLVVIGIGGSYLGARAAIDFIQSVHYNALKKNTPDVYFVGNNLSGEHLEQVIALIGNRDFSVNYISKSGSTLEPASAFRVFKKRLTDKYGSKGAASRIYVTTDAEKGKLRALTDREGYTSFVIPDDVGGRYSVLTPVGLLPAAVADIDIAAMLDGARDIMENGQDEAARYAALRQALYRAGRKIELLVGFEPSLVSTGEWWKQLFGESEGKNGLGIFPASAQFTTDLHSLGQYIQDGERTLFETFVSAEVPRGTITVIADEALEDGLAPLAGESFSKLNDAARQGTKQAHIDGGVPVIELRLPSYTAYDFGMLVQFFELSCGVSALMTGVNPFDQPGVEAYKKNLYAILGLQK